MIGGLYAVMALGLSLTWGLLKVINLAHFALILGSAYVTYQLTTSTGVDPLLAALVLVPCLFVVGVAIHWVILRSRWTSSTRSCSASGSSSSSSS